MKPDLDAIRARCEAATPGPWRAVAYWYDGPMSDVMSPSGEPFCCVSFEKPDAALEDATAQFIAAARTDIPALLAYIDELERQRNVERERADDLMSRLICHEDAQDDICEDITHLRRANASLEHMLGEERENVDTLRAAVEHAEQRFVDEYDAHQETRTLLTDLYMKQLRADAAQMREYGISYAGVRTLLAEYDGGELSIGKVLELLRAAARELAKEEIAELKARITMLEAMR